MKRIIVIVSLVFIMTSAFGQVYEFYCDKNPSGFPFAQTEVNKPIKMVESTSDSFVYGDICLVNMSEEFLGISLIFGDASDDRVDQIKKMNQSAIMKITLSNNEVLTCTLMDFVECDHVHSRVAINTASILCESSLRDLKKIPAKVHDRYICNQLSTYNITKVQINNIGFTFMSASDAKKRGCKAFTTAATIKAMIAKIRPQ